MWHSCGKISLENLFARSEAQVAQFFQEFALMVRACGPVHMIPQKTRVVFQARMRFAGAMSRKSHLICHFILPRRIESDRFYKIETFTPRCHAHYLRVIESSDLDVEVSRWLKEAYEVGQQLHLQTSRAATGTLRKHRRSLSQDAGRRRVKFRQS
ncbi:MAG: DUF5655 domain-containing protein [Chthoniobacterales bacterium]